MFVLSLSYVDIIYAALFFLFDRPCTIPDGDKLLRIKTASISLMDIPSYSNSSKTLGSLVFSDAFIDSVIQVQNKGILLIP